MKEHPILFSGEMVKAILDGRKTVTRRPMKPQPILIKAEYPKEYEYWEWHYSKTGYASGPSGFWLNHSPYKRGDRLYVRETWQAYEPKTQRFGGNTALSNCQMRIFAYPPVAGESIIEYLADAKDGSARTWRPSIHMPKWASRLKLDVIEVEVEHLQDITQEEADNEGADWATKIACPTCKTGLDDNCDTCGTFIDRFKLLWDAQYGGTEYEWSKNPWVWRVAFRRVES